MPKLINRLPKYRLHKASGKAVVTLNGFDHYLGTFGTEESRSQYQRKLAEWMAGNFDAGADRTASPKSDSVSRPDFTIDEIFVRYWSHVKTYYVKDGQPTGEQHALLSALRPLVNLYGPTAAADFGPLQLKAVREQMIGQKLSRKLVNCRVNRIRRMFKWAIENALLSPVILQGLQAVSPLKRGRSAAHETQPVRPLPEPLFEATLQFMSPEIQAMVRVQWYTGMRPGEVVIMRAADLDRTKEIWEYTPASHKTQHHGHTKVIPIGPKGQEVLKPFIRDNPEEFLFSPRRKMAEHYACRRKQRRSPKSPSQSLRIAVDSPRKAPGLHYTTASYGQAIAKACRKAGVPVWGPNRLRHSAATRFRKLYGLDAARVMLGHRSPQITEVYAEIDRTKALVISTEIG